jgi:heat shock protein HslJ
MSCKTVSNKINQNFPSGTYKIVTLNADKFNPEKNYFVNINSEEKRLGGKFDCNNYTVEYEKEKNSINFGYAISTKMYCEGKMHNENAFFGKLNAIKTFSYQNKTLKLFSEENDLIVELKYVKDE